MYDEHFFLISDYDIQFNVPCMTNIAYLIAMATYN